MTATTNSISVYDYTSYRGFLADYYAFRKKRNPSFSYRGFAAKAGISSSGLYKEVVDGKRMCAGRVVHCGRRREQVVSACRHGL